MIWLLLMAIAVECLSIGFTMASSEDYGFVGFARAIIVIGLLLYFITGA